MSNCVFNFNILALVLFGILGGSQIYITGPCAPRRPKWGLGGFVGGVKIFGGNPPRNAMTADLRRLVKKIMEMLKIA